ncbi:hypothetical protein J2S69_002537 [Glycomyces lechevalierae]|uniref:Uncharacterized protein n=1 Tax=Glycomyces lechevalierae TaxID=256034 RepID=A0ABU2AQ80_9ACTN|nr:hypothetical protein [Glycomyces lechevalierae]
MPLDAGVSFSVGRNSKIQIGYVARCHHSRLARILQQSITRWC